MFFGHSRIPDDGRGQECVHRDLVLVEEVVELDVLPVLRRAADPLAVADDQVAFGLLRELSRLMKRSA